MITVYSGNGGGTVPNSSHELYKNNYGVHATKGGLYLILNGT